MTKAVPRRALPLRLLLGALLLSSALPSMAAPRIVVSTAPLHSLVASLMEGVGEPELLLPADTPAGTPTLTAGQKLRLVTADVVLWSGPGLERGLAAQLQAMPAIGDRAVAVSRSLPLLDRRDGPGKDARFWLDPKLAVRAVRYLAPRLARMDPDNLERYLDNEIRLLARLRGLSRTLQARFAPVQGGTVRLAPSDAPYLARRLGLTAVASPLVRVSAGSAAARPASADLAPGTELYFELMEGKARALMQATRASGTHGRPL